MLLKSYAKINLALNITGTRDDGYHLLDMVMLPIELHDTIDIEFLGDGDDTYITCDKVELSESTQYNICAKVVKVLRQRYGFNKSLQINIHKEIPISAGMGGGSSNAATVLKYLVQAAKIKISKEELMSLALEFGADVPFFVENKPSRISGIGEEIKHFDLNKKFYVVVIKPEKGLSTQTVYKECDKFNELKKGDVETLIEGLRKGDFNVVSNNLSNALEAPAIKLLPEIKDYIEFLKSEGLPARMTGSGSAVFALSNSWLKAMKVAKKASKLNYDVFLTKML